MIFISAHSDTNYKHVKLTKDNTNYVGHLDNYVGVFSVMQAYFSGQLDSEHVRVELTYGEETDFEGAIEVAKEVKPDDLVIVVDVTATPTNKDFVIEKCKLPAIQYFLKDVLKNFDYDLYPDCPDPISIIDEVEIYKDKTDFCFFLGLPCEGGDYNVDSVKCKIKSVEKVSKAIIEICKNYSHLIKHTAKNKLY